MSCDVIKCSSDGESLLLCVIHACMHKKAFLFSSFSLCPNMIIIKKEKKKTSTLTVTRKLILTMNYDNKLQIYFEFF